ncbi:unnamed protein product [Heligmosomoides polygyrus]|uniref:Uncharacterized protein n=1 Tax=Heligmosomoides polygyrus TaxID=6339 RepID=A0A183GW27_HELPZ|nr:unnamed protein product [Heligmosomoides polygyrus]
MALKTQTANMKKVTGSSIPNSAIEAGQSGSGPVGEDHAAQKITKDFPEVLENDKRSRSIVISGLEETSQELPPSERQKNLEDEVSKVRAKRRVSPVRNL